MKTSTTSLLVATTLLTASTASPQNSNNNDGCTLRAYFEDTTRDPAEITIPIVSCDSVCPIRPEQGGSNNPDLTEIDYDDLNGWNVPDNVNITKVECVEGNGNVWASATQNTTNNNNDDGDDTDDEDDDDVIVNNNNNGTSAGNSKKVSLVGLVVAVGAGVLAMGMN